jgi:hypothetical protein
LGVALVRQNDIAGEEFRNQRQSRSTLVGDDYQGRVTFYMAVGESIEGQTEFSVGTASCLDGL